MYVDTTFLMHYMLTILLYEYCILCYVITQFVCMHISVVYVSIITNIKVMTNLRTICEYILVCIPTSHTLIMRLLFTDLVTNKNNDRERL